MLHPSRKSINDGHASELFCIVGGAVRVYLECLENGKVKGVADIARTEMSDKIKILSAEQLTEVLSPSAAVNAYAKGDKKNVHAVLHIFTDDS